MNKFPNDLNKHTTYAVHLVRCN